MQLIGLLGGMSWESTAEYYRLANELVRERCGGLHSAPLPHVLGRLRRHRADAGRRRLGRRQRRRWPRRPGAGRGPARTSWCSAPTRCTRSRTADRPRSTSRCCTSATPQRTAITEAGIDRVGLLGTGFTMSQRFYARPAGRSTARVTVPSPATRPSCTASSTTSSAWACPRRVARAVPAGHRPPRRRGCRGGHLRLHRDRAARRPAGQPRAGLPHDPAARRGCRGPGARRTAPCAGPTSPDPSTEPTATRFRTLRSSRVEHSDEFLGSRLSQKVAPQLQDISREHRPAGRRSRSEGHNVLTPAAVPDR